MFLLPIVFGFVFLLTLIFKLIGGKIAWWVVILFGALFVVPMIVLFILMLRHRSRSKLLK